MAETPATPDQESSEPLPPEPARVVAGGTDEPVAPVKSKHAPNASLEPDQLAEFSEQPPRVQAVITAALAMTKQNLTYVYGSADPKNGGLDCSGTIYHLLRSEGFSDVPRDSPGQYLWTRVAGGFHAVISKRSDGIEFRELLPGDLMFWSGTYNVTRDVPVTHVMLYLGTEKKTKKRVMFGASDGRSYEGLQRWGVSVFDFKMPKDNGKEPAKSDFLGYGRIPGLRDEKTMLASTPVSSPETPPRTSSGFVEPELPKLDDPIPPPAKSKERATKSSAAASGKKKASTR